MDGPDRAVDGPDRAVDGPDRAVDEPDPPVDEPDPTLGRAPDPMAWAAAAETLYAVERPRRAPVIEPVIELTARGSQTPFEYRLFG